MNTEPYKIRMDFLREHHGDGVANEIMCRYQQGTIKTLDDLLIFLLRKDRLAIIKNYDHMRDEKNGHFIT